MSQSAPAPRLQDRKKTRRLVWSAIVVLLLGLAAVRAVTVTSRAAKTFFGDERVLVLAHQGASAYAPSNTLEAFALALEQGADIIETDVHMTKDGVVVVSHDATIDRMSNGSGHISAMTLAELRQYDFGYDFTPDGGATFPYRGKGVTIPTLAEVFEKFPGVRVNIELKQEDPTIEEAVWDAIAKHDMEGKVLINSFMSGPMERWAGVLERAAYQTATGATKSNMIEFVVYYLPHLDWLYHPKVDAFQVPVSQKVGPLTIRFDTERFVERTHKLGMKAHFWTINDEATIRHLVSIGADGIITDRPDLAVKVLKEAGLR
ncbi:MAG: glycerophosphodiester phosphodiesterase [Symbiobacteriaceae bacterium]|jgi:glycerophosphoryl diester phosphodiesterase|nr:glycerophosphodiester phosphodiesterase [Symbiobacteriaceae bacterium]